MGTETIITDLATEAPNAFRKMDEDTHDRLTDILIPFEHQGVFITAPDRLDVTEQDELPVVLLVGSTLRRARDVDLKWNSVLLAINLDDGHLYAGAAFAPPANKRPYSRKPGEKSPAGMMDEETSSRDAHRLELRHSTQIPWREGRYLLRLIYADWISNALGLELYSPGVPIGKPALAGDLWNTEAVVSFEPESGLPAAEPGQLVMVATSSDDRLVRLQGSVNIAAEPIHLLAGKSKGIVAGIPVSVLALIQDHKEPVVVSFVIPISDDVSLKEGGEIIGYFSLDFIASASVPRVLYAISGNLISEPVVVMP